ncbi:hypothetical protein AAHE18_06G174300 [Arachis hypogaea]
MAANFSLLLSVPLVGILKLLSDINLSTKLVKKSSNPDLISSSSEHTISSISSIPI